MTTRMTGGLFVVALFLAAINLRLSINSVSPIIETLQSDLTMSAAIASLLTAIPVLCMGVFSPVAAKLGGRWGLERVIFVSLACIAIGTGLRLFVESTLFLILTALIAGIGIASVGPLLSGFIKRHYPSKVTSMIAVYTFALTIGAALASGLSAPLQVNLLSWQSSLALWSIFGFAAVLVWLSVLRRVNQPLTTHTEPESHNTQIPWTNKRAWYLTISFGFLSMLFYAVTAWLPPMIQSMGYSKWYAANALTIFAVVQIPAGLIMRQLLKRFPSRLLWLVIASMIELCGFLLLLLSVQPWIAAFLIGLGAGTLFSLNLLLPIELTNHPQEAASWAAMTQSIGYVIGASGPFILGLIYDAAGNFLPAMIGMIVINILMIFAQLLAVSRRSSASDSIHKRKVSVQ